MLPLLIPVAVEGAEVVAVAGEAVLATTEGAAVRTAVAETVSEVTSGNASRAFVEGIKTATKNLAEKGAEVAETDAGKWGVGVLKKAAAEGAVMTVKVGAAYGAWEAFHSKLGDEISHYVKDKLSSKEATDEAANAQVDKLHDSAQIFAKAHHLSQEMTAFSGELRTPGQGESTLLDLKDALAVTKRENPTLSPYVDKLMAKTDALIALKYSEIGATTEVGFVGKLSQESMQDLKTSVAGSRDVADDRSKVSLGHALDSLSRPQASQSKAGFDGAMAELSVAKDMMMKSIAEGVTHLSANLTNLAQGKQIELEKAAAPLLPAMAANKDQESVKSHSGPIAAATNDAAHAQQQTKAPQQKQAAAEMSH